MVKLRLQRYGTKKRPFYRIVAADSVRARDGRIIEQIGYYDPIAYKSEPSFKEERVKHWLSVGAQPTDSVKSLLRHCGYVK